MDAKSPPKRAVRDMKAILGMRRILAGVASVAATTTMLSVAFAGQALAKSTELLGQPTPGAIDLQRAASPLKFEAIWFHNVILMPIITAITLLVLGLIIWICIRYNKKANPVPAKFSHNTTVEIIWTIVPVVILMVIAIFSFRLLFAYNDMPKPYMTVKATGYQWYWGYEYPDQKISEITSVPLKKAEADAKGVPYLLAADKPLVVPVNQVIRVQVTGADVIHAFALPAFGLKTDAIPGRLNETWFKADTIGVYYGQCSELCGVEHSNMPIEIHVVSQADFDAWVKSKTAPPAATAAAAPAAAPAMVTPAATAPASVPAAAPAAPAV
ncbi:cytochrome c oxidase subunit II [soil metagenome]